MRNLLKTRALPAALALFTAVTMTCVSLPEPAEASGGESAVRADLEAGMNFDFDGFPTRYWTAKVGGKVTRTAYCIQPSRVPDEGAGSAKKMPDSNVISKVMYYCRGYHGWPAAEARLRRLAGSDEWFGADAGYGYVLCHYILSSVYDSPRGEWDDGLTPAHAAFVRKAAKVMLKLPAPPEAKLSITPSRAQALWLSDGSGYLSRTFRLNADKRNSITVRSPRGVVTYNRNTGQRAGSGAAVRISGGQSFDFKITDNRAGGKKFVFGPYRGALYDYTAYKFNARENAQDIAFFALEDVHSDKITVTAGTTGSGKIVKTKENRDGSRSPEAGAVFRVWNTKFGSYEEAARSPYAYSDIITTDENGTAVTGKLLPGTYNVRQTAGSRFHEYIADRQFTIEPGKNGEIVKIGNEETNNDALMALRLVLKKKDIFTGRDIRVKGAEFRIYDEEGKLVSLPKETESGGHSVTIMCDTFVTDENGTFTTPAALKAGTYRIVETKAPLGYLRSPDKTVEISKDAEKMQGVSIDADTVTVDFEDAPQLGTIHLRKHGVYTADGKKVTEDLPNVVFDIIAMEDIMTGDGTLRARKGDVVRTVVTDKNGRADADKLYLGRYGIREKAFLKDGKETNSYKNYLITGTEKISEAVLAPAADRDTVEYDLVIENNGDHKIETEAVCEASGSHYGVLGAAGRKEAGAAAEKRGAAVIDRIKYSHLIPGEKYTLKAVLMDRASGSPVTESGKAAEASAEFVPEASSGETAVRISAGSGALAGKDTVVFEKLYLGGKLVASHCDISSESQTVKWPALSTMALDAATGTHCGTVGKCRITDTVTYSNIEPGRRYTVKGIVMDRNTGKPLVTGGRNVTAEKSFTAEKGSGSAVLEFGLDASDLAGRDVVVFETLESEGVDVAVHHDINAEEQTVCFPAISTTASDAGSGTHSGSVGKRTVLYDRIDYRNLVPGVRYTVKGVLIDKKSGRPVMTGGKAVTAEREFTPEMSDGSTLVKYTADTTGLGGKETVFYETLSVGENECAAHRDINSREQTISFRGAVSPRTGDGLPAAAITALLISGAAALALRKKNRREV